MDSPLAHTRTSRFSLKSVLPGFLLLICAISVLAACGDTPASPTATAISGPTATPTSTATPTNHYPILLISGFGGFGKKASDCPALANHQLTPAVRNYFNPTLHTEKGTFGDFGDTLRNKFGYYVHFTPIKSDPCYSASITDNIGLINDQINITLKEAAAAAATAQPPLPKPDKVIIIAHSTGGVAARAYLGSPDPDTNKLPTDVSDLFTFGAPHEGVNVKPKWFGLLFSLEPNWPDFVVRQSELLADFDPKGMKERVNPSLSTNPNVIYHFYAGDDSQVPQRSAWAKVFHFLYGNQSIDGLISVESATYRHSNIPSLTYIGSHSKDFGAPSYFLSDSEFYQPLLDALAATALRPTPLPTKPPPTEEPILAPNCNASDFVNSFLDIPSDPGVEPGSGFNAPSRLAAAIGQYAEECQSQGLDPETLVKAAANRDIVVKYAVYDSPLALPYITVNNLRTGFVDASSPPIIEVPDSNIVKLGDINYIFYPPVEATSNFIATGPIANLSLRTIVGNDLTTAREQLLTINNIKQGDVGTVRLIPGTRPILELRDFSGELKPTIEPPVIRERPIRDIEPDSR
jgi:pimeloyl-ACP methyl ester carboxylesterase